MSKEAHVIKLVIEGGIPADVELITPEDSPVSMSFGNLKISFSMEKSNRDGFFEVKGTINTPRFFSEAEFNGKLLYKKAKS